jgi:hypothetical protein
LLSNPALALAAGLGTVQHRLENAAQYLMRTEPKDFPDDMREAFEKIMFLLTADIRNRSDGKIKSTTDTMSDVTADRIVKEIVALYDEIARLNPDR